MKVSQDQLESSARDLSGPSLRRYRVTGLKHLSPGEIFNLEDADDFHHIFHVCRHEENSEFEALDEEGWAHQLRVVVLGKKKAQILCLKSRSLPKAQSPHIYVLQCLPKPTTWEGVLARSTELGAYALWPLVSEYSYFRKASEFLKIRSERWEKILKGSSQQCGRGDLLQVSTPLPLIEAVKKFLSEPGSLLFFAFEGPAVRSLKEEIVEAQRNRDGKSRQAGAKVEGAGREVARVGVLIGSEGGFSKTEVQALIQQGVVPVTMGEQILRVETACLSLVSILKYEFHSSGEKGLAK